MATFKYGDKKPSEHPDTAWHTACPSTLGTVNIADCLDIPDNIIEDEDVAKQFISRHAFNGSIVWCKGQMFLYFRADGPCPWHDGAWATMSTLWVTRLYEDPLKPGGYDLSMPRRVMFDIPDSFVDDIGGRRICSQTNSREVRIGRGQRAEDPRAYVDGWGELHVVIGNGFQVYDLSVDLSVDHVSGHTVQKVRALSSHLGSSCEKNWVPFLNTRGETCFIRWTTANIHEVIVHKYDSRRPRHIEVVSMHTEHSMPASWFTDGFTGIRGGCIAEYSKTHNLHIFHSQRVSREGAVQYVAGALVFSKSPPYKVSHVTQKPLWKSELIPPSIPRMNTRLASFYPCGALVTSKTPLGDAASWTISGGFNDWKVAIVHLTKSELDENLIPVH
jgi:hypothetical protein